MIILSGPFAFHFTGSSAFLALEAAAEVVGRTFNCYERRSRMVDLLNLAGIEAIPANQTVEKASQSFRPQAKIKFNLCFPGACITTDGRDTWPYAASGGMA